MKKDNVDQKSKGLVVIPYVESVTEKATRVFRRYGISTAVRPHTTLRKMLVHPKDKRDPLTTTDCVYELPIPCSNCNSTYIWETGRRFSTRLNEHKKETEKVEASRRNFTRQSRKQSESEQSRSAVADHAVQNNHVINWQDVKVLCKECNHRSHLIREAIWIRGRAPSTVGGDGGAHYLSHIYDPLSMSSTSSRAPPCGNHRKQKFDQPSQFWWSALPESTKLSIVSQLFGFGKWISLYCHKKQGWLIKKMQPFIKVKFRWRSDPDRTN